LAPFPKETLRIIDANLDRATEGLRVLEDIARFVLDAAVLAGGLKEVRHQLHQALAQSTFQLIEARDVAGDIGREAVVEKESAVGLIDTVTANARRVEQSLRVLEELSRSPEAETTGAVFEQARYKVYGFEKELVGRLSRRDKLVRLDELYVIVTPGNSISKDSIIAPGVVHLVAAGSSRNMFFRTAETLRAECASVGALFVVGEHIDVALAIKADGVVIDANSLPPATTRQLLRLDQLLGFAARTTEEAIMADKAGADFILVSEKLGKALAYQINTRLVTPCQGGSDA
jgi:thiamine-phosphate pyrophosphorylase